jgi:hypothetical protein
MIFTDRNTRNQRLEICKACPHYIESTRTCGPLIIGEDQGELVKIDGRKRKVRLCGCIMPVKTRLKTSKCPLGKWGSLVDAEALKALKIFVQEMESKGAIKTSNIQPFLDAYNKAFDTNKKYTSCSTCIKQMYQEAKEALK